MVSIHLYTFKYTMSTEVQVLKKTTERRSFKKNLSDEQVNALEHYFSTVDRMPKRKAKLQLSEQLKIDPAILNRWFQTKRNKTKTTQSKAKLVTKRAKL